MFLGKHCPAAVRTRTCIHALARQLTTMLAGKTDLAATNPDLTSAAQSKCAVLRSPRPRMPCPAFSCHDVALLAPRQGWPQLGGVHGPAGVTFVGLGRGAREDPR